jgi:hypothetical protein
MLAAEQYPSLFADLALPKREPLQIHRGKISLHHAKAGYSYPTIRLPRYLAESLAGLSTRTYQTVHDGALAFLVVVLNKPAENTAEAVTKRESTGKSPRLDMAEVAGEAYGEKKHNKGKKGLIAKRRGKL